VSGSILSHGLPWFLSIVFRWLWSMDMIGSTAMRVNRQSVTDDKLSMMAL
jgi:hypothetical protein